MTVLWECLETNLPDTKAIRATLPDTGAIRATLQDTRVINATLQDTRTIRDTTIEIMRETTRQEQTDVTTVTENGTTEPSLGNRDLFILF